MSSSDDEQLAAFKDWWQRNGKPLLTGGLLALVVVLGWNTWQKYQGNQSQGASNLYQALLETTLTPTGQPDMAKVADLSGKLKNEFGGSAYAQYASLFVAKVAVESGKLDDAAAELKSVLDKPADATLGEIARQRLARVLAAQNKVEDGLKLLEGDADKAFNVSAVIAPDTWYAVLLRGTIGFTPEMAWGQIIGWALYVGITLTVFLRQMNAKTPAK